MLQPRSGKAKLDHVNSILSDLEADLDTSKLSTPDQTKLLEQLKVHGRSTDNAEPIFTRRGLQILGRYAFERDNVTPSQEALRCIANALLLQPHMRQILVDLGYGPPAAEKLKNDSLDDEFLVSRILFLATYNTSLDYSKLVEQHQLAENINAAIDRHAQRSEQQTVAQQSSPLELMALSETLKLVFNIIHFHPLLSKHFSDATSNVFKILVQRNLPEPPLEAPVNHLVNVLLNLDLDKKSEGTTASVFAIVFPDSDPNRNADHLITILDHSIRSYPEADLDNKVAPSLTLVRRLHDIAPEAVKQHMQHRLLPTAEERDKPLGKSDTLPSRLLNLSTSALTPNLRGSISAMLFELSSKDAATFVQNVGYGFASGFLMSNNIPMPEDVVNAHAKEQAERGIPVNPITGQRVDREDHDNSEPMTQEEKEREAERLFVLFERLKATGVMNVQNPVEQAFRSGRIEELPDDED